MTQRFLWSLLAAAALAQSQKAFDVVSIKPDRDGHGMDASIQPGGRYTARNVSPKFLITQAFGIRDFQVSGHIPKWFDEEHYDIAAKVDIPNQLKSDQLQPLLQGILVDRFKLKFHKEMRSFPGYSLELGKNGPKISVNHNILLPPSLNISSNSGRATMTGRRISLSELAKHLSEMTGRSVSDNTGLKGDFDFKLDWAPSDSVDDALPTVFVAVQEQLGLKLSPVKKSMVEVLVIESMEKASAN